MPSNGKIIALYGRSEEQQALKQLLDDVRTGASRVLVLHGDAGSGKSALLDYAAGAAVGARVIRASGVESEAEIAYATLHQVCGPLLEHLQGLPEPQREALSIAFGLSTGPAPQTLVLGLAVLGLLAEAAAHEPLVCVLDDAQWMDRMSQVLLTFVARRLQAESVALLFAVRSSGEQHVFSELPQLKVSGLPPAEARALLDRVLPGPMDERVRDRIVAETHGNPLALLELPHTLTPAELTFGLGTREGAPLATRVENGFAQRITSLPPDTRQLVLTAAVEPTGDVPLLRRALKHLGIEEQAATAAETAGLLHIGSRVVFRHPLARSAAWRAAEVSEVRTVHAALAAVTDAKTDPDRRAWHQAHAATAPHEDVAAELARSADRALARGGRSAAAAFLERAAELTPDPTRRGVRLLGAARARLASGAPALVPDLLAAAELSPLDAAHQAELERLRAQVAFELNHGRAAGPALLAAAQRLQPLDEAAARRTYLAALGAAVNAGCFGRQDRQTSAQLARSAPAADDVAGSFVTALSTWSLDGYAPSVPHFLRALQSLTADEDLDLLWVAVPAAFEVWDDVSLHRLTEQAVSYARATGAMSILPGALSFRASALIFAGRFADAAGLLEEADALGRATGLAPHPGTAMVLAAWQGDEDQALRLIDTVTKDAQARGTGRVLALAGCARAGLYNGLGNYSAAALSAQAVLEHDDLAIAASALLELIEAATHSGQDALASTTCERLTERTDAAGTRWALGAQALGHALTGASHRSDQHYQEAISCLDNGRLDFPLARARLLYGEWLRRENRRGDARVQLRAAYEAFTVMGAAGFAARAERELTATGEIMGRRTSGVRVDLSAQETQIARLAVAGRTNAEIGAVLFLSPRTVEWHLRKVFTKLGISSRRELSDALREN